MLGEYAPYVLGAYGVTIALIGGLVVLSILRSSKVRKALSKLEQKDG